MDNNEDYWDLTNDDSNSDYWNSTENVYSISDLFEGYEYLDWPQDDYEYE